MSNQNKIDIRAFLTGVFLATCICFFAWYTPSYDVYNTVEFEYVDENGEIKSAIGLMSKPDCNKVNSKHKKVYYYTIEEMYTDNIKAIEIKK